MDFSSACWSSPSVVIDKINIESPAVRETKNDSPVRPHRDGPKSLKLTSESVEPEARAAQPLNRFGGIERGQDFADAFHQLWRQMLAIVVLVKSPQPVCRKLSIIAPRFCLECKDKLY